MRAKLVIREGLLDRLKTYSGLKTDESLAGAIGVSGATLSKLKHGAEPTAATVAGIYTAFGLTPGEVLTVSEQVKELDHAA